MTIRPGLQRPWTPAQLEAISARGRTLVAAAAGSGKTSVLVERIVRSLLGDGGANQPPSSDPRGILAVTFTRKAAAEMRERVARELHVAGRLDLLSGLDLATIGTIHSLCGVILRDHGAAIGIDPGFQLLEESQEAWFASQALEDVLAQLEGDEDVLWLRSQTKDGRIAELIRELRSLASRTVGGTITWPDLERLTASDKHGVTRDSARRATHATQRIWREFERVIAERLRLAGALTFDTLEQYALQAVRDPHVVTALRERWQLIAIDEFQDTNEIQLGILDAIAGDRLFMVGDEWQSIYRFRGADVRVFRAQQVDRRTTIIPMRENFRSTVGVLDVVNTVFAAPQLFGQGYAPVVPGTPEQQVQLASGRAVELLTVSKSAADEANVEVEGARPRAREANVVAQRIASLLSDGVDASDVVVVYETRTQIDVLELALRARNVPFLRLASSGFYDQFDVRDVLTIVRAVRNPLDDLAVASALAGPLANLTYGALARVLEQAGVGRGDAARNREGDPQRQSVLEVAASMDDDAARLASHIQRLRTIERTASIVEVIEYIVTQPEIELGAASTELGVQRLANMRQLVALAAEARQVGIGDCARFLEYVDAQRRFRKVGEASIADEATGAIRLMSIHASKGLEFDHVFFVKSDQITRSVPPGKPPTPLLDGDGVLHIPAPSEDGPIRDTGALEQLRAVDQQAHDEERMRKAYVAMTRAKSHLYVSGVHDPVAEHIEEHETTFSLDVDPAGSPLTWIADRMQIDLGSRAIGDELHEQLVVRRGPAGEVTVLAHKHGRVEHALSEQLIAPDQHALLDATNHRLDNDATHALSQALAEAVTQVRDREIRLADGTRIHDALARLMTDAVERGVAFDQLTQEGRTPWLTPRTSARLTPVAASEVFTRLVALHARAEVAWIAPFGAVTTSRSADGIPIVADAQLVDDGRIDVLAVLPDGRWWIVDWKVTLPELAADAWQAHGAQLTRYAVAARQGGAVGAVLSLVDISHPSRVHTWDGSALDVSNVGRRAPAMPMQLSALPAT